MIKLVFVVLLFFQSVKAMLNRGNTGSSLKTFSFNPKEINSSLNLANTQKKVSVSDTSYLKNIDEIDYELFDKYCKILKKLDDNFETKFFEKLTKYLNGKFIILMENFGFFKPSLYTPLRQVSEHNVSHIVERFLPTIINGYSFKPLSGIPILYRNSLIFSEEDEIFILNAFLNYIKKQ